MIKLGHISNDHPAQSAFKGFVVPALLVASLALRLLFWTGPTGSDDVNYFKAAERFAAFRHFDEIHHYVRLLFLLVIGGPAVVAGAMSVGILINVVISVLNDALVVWIAYRHYGRSAAFSREPLWRFAV